MLSTIRLSRRALAGSLLAATAGAADASSAEFVDPRLLVTGFELLHVRATGRTVWIFVRLRTNRDVTGLGEASDAFGYSNTTDEQVARMKAEVGRFVELLQGRPLDIARFRSLGEPVASTGGLVAATAFSAIEQALWDLAGRARGLPTHRLLAEIVGRSDAAPPRVTVPVYANINRATTDRSPAGFAAIARAAVAFGFRALKAAPFDGFPKPGSSSVAVEAAVDRGIECLLAMREAVGPTVELMADCHGFFDVDRGTRVARRLEPVHLAWYEEPVPPEQVDDLVAIRRAIRQPMAGGELLFGVNGFRSLCERRAVDVIMPDVKHCGGLQALLLIASLAEQCGLGVSPHNPSGPVGTAASLQACALLKTCRSLEVQWNEVAWREALVTPRETIIDGTMAIPEAPGFGIEVNAERLSAR